MSWFKRNKGNDRPDPVAEEVPYAPLLTPNEVPPYTEPPPSPQAINDLIHYVNYNLKSRPYGVDKEYIIDTDNYDYRVVAIVRSRLEQAGWAVETGNSDQTGTWMTIKRQTYGIAH